MTRHKRRALLILAASAAVLAALLAGTPQGRAIIRPTWGFESLDAEPRVRFEAEAEANARRVAAVLDRTLARVESAHGNTFPEPPTVFVCGTQESFNAFLAQPVGRATGVVVLGRLLLSPRSFREGTFEAVLGHELSHLLLRRRRGWVRQLASPKQDPIPHRQEHLLLALRGLEPQRPGFGVGGTLLVDHE